MLIKKLLYLGIIFLLLSITVTALEIGPNYEKDCQLKSCSITLYSNQKYYQNNGAWTLIDENFNTENCAQGHQYCVNDNLYQVHFPQNYGIPLTKYKDKQLSFDLTSIGEFTLTDTQGQITENIITYPNIISGVDIRYTYLPHKIKEEIIINSKDTFALLQKDLELVFSLNTFTQDIVQDNKEIHIGDFVLRDFFAYDASDNYLDIPFTLVNDQLTLTIAKDWLLSDERAYPLTIDPSVQINVNVSEDLHVYYNAPNSWTRQNSLNHFRVGKKRTTSGGFPPSISELVYRGGIDWDITNIPNDATVIALNLTLYANQDGAGFNENISITHMEGNSSTYNDNNSDNELYWNDMLNGAVYTTITMSGTGFKSFNLTNATNDFENALANDTFSIGLVNANDTKGTSVDVNEWRFRSVEATNAARRPVLMVTYATANESEGDISIEQGILNAIPSAIIHDEQQVYTRLANSTQELGRFDKFVIFGNQRWAINYVASGESFTNMNNVSDIFLVLELEGLTIGQIEQQVEDFITNTKH